MTASTHTLSDRVAAFQYLGKETADDRKAAQAADRAAGLPTLTVECGGDCAFCGRPISNVYRFRSPSGKELRLGIDCAKLAGLGELVRRHAEEAREAAASQAREARLAAERDANEALGLGRITNDEHVAAVKAQREAVQQARRDASEHFGAVKQRLRGVELRYEGHYDDLTYATYSGRIEECVVTTYFLRTVEGDNAVIWRTQTELGPRKDGTKILKGESFVAAFTVKSHSEYKGEKQTEVQRLVVG